MRVSNGHALSLSTCAGRQGKSWRRRSKIQSINPSINSVNAKFLTNRNPSPRALTSHRITFIPQPVWPVVNEPLANRWLSASRKPQRAYLPKPSPIRYATPERRHTVLRLPAMHRYPPSRSAAANESRVPDAGSASPWHTPHMHTHMCCTALIPAWPRRTGQNHLNVRSLFVAAIVSVVVGADVSGCHCDRQNLVICFFKLAAPGKAYPHNAPIIPSIQPQGLRFALLCGSGLHLSHRFRMAW